MRRATPHVSPKEITPTSVVVVIRPKMTVANDEGAATSISIVPFQRSVVIVHPELKSASHHSAMNVGAMAAYAVRSCRPAWRKIIWKMIENIGAVKNGIRPSGYARKNRSWIRAPARNAFTSYLQPALADHLDVDLLEARQRRPDVGDAGVDEPPEDERR